MKIDIEQAIKFLDSKNKDGHTSSIIGIVGEDLNACAFKNYMKHKEKAQEVKVLTCPVTIGKKKGKKGKRLDRWIYIKKQNGEEVLYQCEIKNWGANAIGGKSLSLDADNDKIWNIAKYNWENQRGEEKKRKGSFSDSEYPNGLTKVFVRMEPPKEYEKIKVEPLILYWMPLSNKPNLNPLFKVATPSFNNPNIKTGFSELNIFSVSIYLRFLLKNGIKYLEEGIPRIKDRLEILDKICLKSKS